MHLSSGILDGHTEAVAGVIAIGGLGVAAAAVRRARDPRLTAARFAAVSATVFAGQMLNFPVASGTSGHLIGAAIAVALLGWAGGLVSVSLVLGLQCVLFGDGGLSALGANVVNMAIVPVVVAAAVLRDRLTAPRLALAGLASVLAAALAFSVEFAVGGATGDAATVTRSMLEVHLLIGLGEAVLTVAVVVLASRVLVRPAYLFGVAAVAVLAAPWAASTPDGLSRVAIDRGFESFATDSPVTAPFADYQWGDGRLGVIAAGLVGVVAAAMVGWLVARATVPSSTSSSPAR